MESADVEVCASGLGLLESVRWANGAVWFSDWTAGVIRRYDPDGAATEVVARVDSLPLCFDLAGSELYALDAQRSVLRRGVPNGDLDPWVEVSTLSLGGGNEVIVHGDWTYLNFGNFDPRRGFPTEPVGLIAAVDSAGQARVVADHLDFPNGMAITPDGAELVVAESHAGRLTAWTIAPDGGLTDRRVWADLDTAAPDGISMAPDGTCWYADVPARRVTHVAEGGAVLGHIEVDRGAFSCALAPELGTLFIAAANWPGGARMFDPGHDWDGQLLAAHLY